MKQKMDSGFGIQDSRGFNLIEMIIAMVVFTLLGLSLTTLFATGSTLMQVGENKLVLQQQARLSLDRVLKELRLARPGAVTIPASQDSITFQIPQSINTNSGAITWSGQITYSLGGINNTQLIRTEAGQPNMIMANDINTIATDPNRIRFVGDQNPNPNLITVTMGLRRTTLRGYVAQAALIGQVKVRNP